jgi:hypothetical protein
VEDARQNIALVQRIDLGCRIDQIDSELMIEPKVIVCEGIEVSELEAGLGHIEDTQPKHVGPIWFQVLADDACSCCVHVCQSSIFALRRVWYAKWIGTTAL